MHLNERLDLAGHIYRVLAGMCSRDDSLEHITRMPLLSENKSAHQKA